MRPSGRLGVGEHLAQVVPIVVNPLVEQLVHPKPADLWMPAAALQIGGAKPGDQAGAVATQCVELGDQRRGWTLAVVPRASDLALIPGFEARLVPGQDETNPAGEAAALALDEVAEDFVIGASARGR
jgi:hypothetical protein